MWLLAVVYTAAAAGFLPPPVSTSPPPPPRPPSSTDGNSLQHHHAAEANYPVTLPHCSAHCHVTRVPETADCHVTRVRPAPRSTGDWRWALRDPDVSLGRVQPSSGGAASSVQPATTEHRNTPAHPPVICKNICMAKLCSLNKVCKLRTMPPLLPPRAEQGTSLCPRLLVYRHFQGRPTSAWPSAWLPPRNLSRLLLIT